LLPWIIAAALVVNVAAISLLTLHPSPPSPVVPKEPALPPAVSDLETRGLSAMLENTPERTADDLAYLRRAVAAAPNSAPVWGSLAISYVPTLGWTTSPQRATVADRARDAAAHAQAIDPRES